MFEAWGLGHEHNKFIQKLLFNFFFIFFYSLSKIVIDIYPESYCVLLYMLSEEQQRKDKYPVFGKLTLYLQRLVIQI